MSGAADSTAGPDVDAFYADLWRRHGWALAPPELRRWRRMARDLRRFATLPRPWRVLDYGCGSGRFLPLLAPLGEVWGFDVTPAVLEEVARRHPQARIVAGDGTFPTALPADAFAVVVASEVIEHVIDQQAMAADLFRVLAPGGLLLLTTPNARFEARYKAGTRGLQPVENWLDADALRRLLDTAGFEVLATGTLGAHWANLPYRRWLPYRLLKKIGRRLGAWDRVDDLESAAASLLGRGITLSLTARKPP